jgi:hypothetical protein
MSTKPEVGSMARRTKHLNSVTATVATVIALAAPAAVPADTVRGPSSATLAHGTTADCVSAPEQAGAARGRGGLDRRDALAAVTIFAGVLLLGLRGYVVVGAVIAGVAAVLAAGARLVTGDSKRQAWKDWPSPAVARVAGQNAREPRPVGRAGVESEAA